MGIFSDHIVGSVKKSCGCDNAVTPRYVFFILESEDAGLLSDIGRDFDYAKSGIDDFGIDPFGDISARHLLGYRIKLSQDNCGD